MYDRKTWIVVGVCAVLLAVNYYYGHQAAKEKGRIAAAERAAQAAEQAEAQGEPDKPGVTEQLPPAPEDIIQTKTVTLETEETVFTLTTLGGGVKTAELINQAVNDGSDHRVVLNQGDSSAVGALAEGPDGLERVNYTYLEDESTAGTRAVFAARHPSGLIVKKTWSLIDPEQPGAAYSLDLQVDVENSKDSQAQIPLDRFSLYLGRAAPLQASESRFSPPKIGLRDDGDYTSLSTAKEGMLKEGFFSRAQSQVVRTADELQYAGVSSQFFTTTLRHKNPTGGGIWGKATRVSVQDSEVQQNASRAGLILPSQAMAPGSRQTLNFQLFMGPRDNRMLRQMGNGMGDIMDYGWFTIFSRLMNFLLVHIHDGVAKISGPWSWGWAIVIVTIVVRTLMWPLYSRSNRTMKRMAKLKPEMDKLKEKYPDDPAKMQQEVMGLYKTYGINPVGGCLPMLAQIPIFFGFFRMLQNAAELRGHGFLWVDDLSQPDTIGHLIGFPINILPILMGVTSFAQMAMMPNTSADKTQATIMKLMPIMFLVFCYNYASALALYWTTSNLFSIVQTWITKRMPEPELKAKPQKPGKKSFMERMAAAAEQQQKMRQAQGRVVESDDEGPKKKRGPRTGG